MSPSTPNSHSVGQSRQASHRAQQATHYNGLPSPSTPSSAAGDAATSSIQAPRTPVTPSPLSSFGRIDSATSLVTASSSTTSLDGSTGFVRASTMVDLTTLASSTTTSSTSSSSTLTFTLAPASASNNPNGGSSSSSASLRAVPGAPPTPPLYRRRHMRFPLSTSSSSSSSNGSGSSVSALSVTESSTVNRQSSPLSSSPFASRLSTAAANAAAAYAASIVTAQEQANAINAHFPSTFSSTSSTVSSSMSFEPIRQSQAVTPPTQIIHWTSLLPFGHPNRTVFPLAGASAAATGQYSAAAAAAAAATAAMLGTSNGGDIVTSQQPNASTAESAPNALQRLQALAHPAFPLARPAPATSSSTFSRAPTLPLSTSTNSTFNRPPTSSTTPPPPVISPAQTHPQFRTKPVCHLACRHCHRLVSNRAMKAVLLADTRVELFSTDLPLKGAVALVNGTYVTANCKCHIRDIACLGCGNCIGYHVTQPCTSCTAACNNGQRTMLTDAVSVDRKHPATGADVVWGQLPSVTSLRDMQLNRAPSAPPSRAAPVAGGDWVVVNHPMSSALVGVGDTSAMTDGELRDAVIVENSECEYEYGVEEGTGGMGIMGGWIVKGEACDVQTVGAEHFVGQR